MAVSPPTYTQLPNEILDLMPDMEESELRVVLVIARQTFGWHRESDRISVTQLMAKTGMARQSVLNGLQAAISRGLVERKQVGAQGYCYRLLIAMPEKQPVQSVDRSNGKTGLPVRQEPVQSVDHEPVYSLDTQKKEINKGNKGGGVATSDKDAAAAAVDQTLVRRLIDEQMLMAEQATKAVVLDCVTHEALDRLKLWRQTMIERNVHLPQQKQKKPQAILAWYLKRGLLPDDLPPPPEPEQEPVEQITWDDATGVPIVPESMRRRLAADAKRSHLYQR